MGRAGLIVWVVDLLREAKFDDAIAGQSISILLNQIYGRLVTPGWHAGRRPVSLALLNHFFYLKITGTMKALTCRFLLSCLLLSAATETFSQKTSEPEAIKQLLVNVRAAFDSRDLTRFAGYFVKSPDMYYQIYTSDGNILMARGWDAMTHMVGGYMKENPEPEARPYLLTDYQIHFNGNTAWASANGATTGVDHMSRDLIVFEKQGGQWKVIALTAQSYPKGKLVVIK
jgi:ketosteroid isomerase-like protein